MILRFVHCQSQAPTFLSLTRRAMSSSSSRLTKPIHFGPFEVTDQVFHTTAHSFALVNIKPILPGHVLVVPHRQVPRVTDLNAAEVADLFTTVQRVQRMLAKRYFTPGLAQEALADPLAEEASLGEGSFNLAIQDGPESGQTVPHVHCHIIPRTKESAGEGDGIYDRLQGEEGNVGGGFWDARPEQRGKFPKIEESARVPRSKESMNEEAEMYKVLMHAL